MVTVHDVAEWMAQTLKQTGSLSHHHAVRVIDERFGKEFLCRKKSGGLSIRKTVLDEFRRLTQTRAVWDGLNQRWRRPLPEEEEKRVVEALREAGADNEQPEQENRPACYTRYKRYWISKESVRLGDEQVPNIEYVVIDPVTKEEVDRCKSLQDARDSIEELTDFYSGDEDE